ncbi:MAG: glycoside hydrolase family 13 protein [Bacteroidia bacterium]|nr:glycoside hydrolase family 13 protein [Bacteroidia bacterium]
MIRTSWAQIAAICLIFILTGFQSGHAQIQRVEPPNWWAGMTNPELQLLVQGDGIGEYEPRIEAEGVQLIDFHKADSKNYLFIDLDLDGAQAGNFTIFFEKKSAKTIEWNYELKSREFDYTQLDGFDSKDVIYLITPDRFANGDPSNDIFDSSLEQGINRKNDYARHGGDINGILKNLDYLQDMGFTAVWPSPMLENNMPQQSYHGYAITDYYKVDPRFGSLEEYRELGITLREMNMKLIFDGVVNHCGSKHWWMEDMPFKDWVNFPDSLKVTTHRRTTNQDPYASNADKKLMNGGWFVSSMPDLNQTNPFMAKYLIQNSIWWVETLQLGGIRQDTYPYPDKNFLSDWTCAIMTEYPDFSIVGEEWSYNPLVVSYWQEGHVNKDGYTSCLKSVMDFPMQANLRDALNEKEEWGKGLVKLYENLANDIAYVRPNDLLIFGDNHDMGRIHTQLNNDVALTKMAVAYLLTTRGIPQIYYGTEILMENSAKPDDHGLIRSDFPGGWEGDKLNGFGEIGLSKEQKDMKDYMKKLLNWRLDNEAITSGKTMHFAPQNGTYVYFRYKGNKKVMVVLNKNKASTPLGLSRFAEILPNDSKAKDVLTGQSLVLRDKITLKPKSALILEIE